MNRAAGVAGEGSSFWRGVRKHFITGIATLFPLFVTGYIILWIVRVADGLVGNHVNAYLSREFGFAIPGLGLIVAVALIFGTGLVYNIFFGRKILPLFERLFMRIPLVSNIYPSAKQLSDFMFTAEKKEKFEKVVLVRFPEKGTYSIGFVTNEQVGRLQEDADQELVSVFVPFAPAPFSGHILLVPRDRFSVIDMSVDRAIKFVVSGGVVLDRPPAGHNREADPSSQAKECHYAS